MNPPLTQGKQDMHLQEYMPHMPPVSKLLHVTGAYFASPLPDHLLCLACYANCFERCSVWSEDHLNSMSITPEEVIWHGLLSNTRGVAKCILTLL